MSRVLVVLAVSQQIGVGTPTGVSVVWPEMVSRCELGLWIDSLWF